MYTLKDKVSNQLSRLFTDSPNHNSSSPSPDPSQGRQFSSEGKSFSSYFSFPYRSFNFGGSGSKRHQHGFHPIQSQWGAKGSESDCEYAVKYQECNIMNEDEDYFKVVEDPKQGMTVCTKPQTAKTHESNDGASARSCNDNDVFEEAREQQTPRSPLSNLMDESSFISPELFEFLHSSLPNIVKGCKWVLAYSTLKHGISLRTLIRKSADFPGPCVLVVGDRQGAVFGGLLNCPLQPTPKRKYQGTVQSFVFTTIYGEPRLFRPTGANRYYYMCLNDLLALGGGSSFALCLDGDLLNGTSGPSETYGNMCLAHKPEFDIKNVELWGFTHSSRYLA
ncbi:TLD-domain containing nucleolar protein [Euphorbia peplus]|nr:TLD-domain containing nucleolar protein [Euphorbia peplus]